MEPDILLSDKGLLAVVVIMGFYGVVSMIALIVATFQNEKLEKRLAEANEQLDAVKKEKEQHDLLCEGAFRLMTWLKERDQ